MGLCRKAAFDNSSVGARLALQDVHSFLIVASNTASATTSDQNTLLRINELLLISGKEDIISFLGVQFNPRRVEQRLSSRPAVKSLAGEG